MKIYLATFMEPIQGRVLSRKKAKKRLISYYYINKNRLNNKGIFEYLTTGRLTK